MNTLNYIQDVSVAFSHGAKEKPYESNIDGGINYASMQLPPVAAESSLAASGVIVDTITDYCKLNYPKPYARVGIQPCTCQGHARLMQSSVCTRT